MDFLRIIRSIEEFLYEAMTWILFYPRTFWRSVRHPDWIVAYTDKTLGESPGKQFADVISPPLFLILSILIAHGIELALHSRLLQPSENLVGLIAGSEQGLLAFRALIFSVYPLVMAAGLLRLRGHPIDRDTLRTPFYMQCYLAGPFAVVVSTASALVRAQDVRFHGAGMVLLLVAVVWFVAVETRWLHLQIERSAWRAFFIAAGYLLVATLIVFAFAAIAAFA